MHDQHADKLFDVYAEVSGKTSNSLSACWSCIAGRIGVTPSLAHHRMVDSELANGWNSGGCGFCSGLGMTPTDFRMPFSTPAPYFAVVSTVHGVSPAGIFQYLP